MTAMSDRVLNTTVLADCSQQALLASETTLTTIDNDPLISTYLLGTMTGLPSQQRR